MLIDEMKRERRSFWSILFVFFLLLAAVGGLMVYNMQKVRDVAADAQKDRFRTIGETSSALSELRSQQNDGAVAQRAVENDRLEGQKMIAVFLTATQAPAASLETAAVDFSKNHFLGRSLNMSSAALVSKALQAPALPAPSRALLQAALFDWNSDKGALSEDGRAREMAELRPLADLLLADPNLAFYGHAAMAAHQFRRASNNDVYMKWEGGCSELVDAVDAALSDPVAPASADPTAAGLNLNYWRGQCLRRHGDTDKALLDFQHMMKFAESDGIPPTNPLKFQAYHGIGTVTTTLLESGGGANGQRAAAIAAAKSYLENAGDFRMSSGMTEVGKISSTGNMGFLFLKETEPDRYVRALEHTQRIDEVHATTWNLVARLVAARAVLDEGLPDVFTDEALKQQDAAMRAKYGPDQLREIVFRTLAELAYQKAGTLPKVELSKLLDEVHHPVLDEAEQCIGQRDACYRKLIASGRG